MTYICIVQYRIPFLFTGFVLIFQTKTECVRIENYSRLYTNCLMFSLTKDNIMIDFVKAPTVNMMA